MVLTRPRVNDSIRSDVHGRNQPASVVLTGEHASATTVSHKRDPCDSDHRPTETPATSLSKCGVATCRAKPELPNPRCF